MTSESDLLALAELWWPSSGADDACGAVSRIVRERHDLVPALFRALVQTAPQGGLPFIGTSLIEDLIMQTEFEGLPPREVMRLVLAAGLDTADLFGVLSGVYAELLSEIGAGDRLNGLLSVEQVEWLLDGDAPDRLPHRGITVLDGDGVRFVPGETEWVSRYGPPNQTNTYPTD